ncbi:antiviral RADAR system adenosine triphosphatase RdrA [Aeromonas hydrophila]|uniref:antiviral RADAR system adenosine triphosphatase RdrA n=1 Tax=Aeromonas hydrophila TaxID=644 RepID=UPI0038D198CF
MIDNTKRYISIAQPETATLSDPNTLLARNVYDRLYTLIDEAQQEASKAIKTPNHSFDSLRAHNAVLIDGERGTGKSTVLVNLPAYLKQISGQFHRMRGGASESPSGVLRNNDLLERVHILKPVDPTLLEEHDDLFLHVIVAAVLSDNQVQLANHDEPNYHAMLRALEELAYGLESVDAQKEERGLDKLRSFIGNRQLNSKVHAFFRSVLTLLGKDLLVLPIDDVDTALDRAYENLEIVRRYLNTPLVLPLISGDLELYNEVIWREFQGKIIKPTPQYEELSANQWAVRLAAEYQRKILPVPNRMRMPDIVEYLRDFNIELRSPDSGKQDSVIASLGAFHYWLEWFITGPINAMENSRLALPIPSIRALTQLIRRCGQDRILEQLPNELRQAQNILAAKRAGQLSPNIRSELVDQFNADYAKAELAKERDFTPVYKNFAEIARPLEADREDSVVGMGPDVTLQLSKRLHEQFRYELEAGPICLVLEAMQHWYGANDTSSILATALFQPLDHTATSYKNFKKRDSLTHWAISLDKQLPRFWLAEMGKREVLLPYPVPESGRWGSLNGEVVQAITDPQQQLLIKLLTHYNYYSESNRGTKINIGRLFELLITSLIRDVSVLDVTGLLNRAPFHSTSTLAPTKTQGIGADDNDADGETVSSDSESLPIDAINTLVEEIKTWRNDNQLKWIRFSPWLVYNVFNKVFNQAQLFNRNQRIDNKSEDYAKIALETGLHAFYSIWSACGSFEKGPLFGLPARISTVNLQRTSSFEKNPLFRQNILPFFPQSGSTESDVACYGKAMRAMTYYLGTHPLKKWLENAVKAPGDSNESNSRHLQTVVREPANDENANLRLRELLKIRFRKENISSNTLENALKQLTPEEVQSILDEMHTQFSDTEALRRLEKAYAKLLNDQQRES